MWLAEQVQKEANGNCLTRRRSKRDSRKYRSSTIRDDQRNGIPESRGNSDGQAQRGSGAGMRKDNGEGQRTMESTKVIYLYGVVDHAEAPLRSRNSMRLLEFAASDWRTGSFDPGRPLQEFGEEALHERMKDPKWLEEQVWNHALVLEAAMRFGTVIPMKLLTIFRTEKSLLDSLSALDESLRALFARLQGKEEWGVKGFCDLPIIQEAVEAQDDGLRQLKAQFAGNLPARPTSCRNTTRNWSCERVLCGWPSISHQSPPGSRPWPRKQSSTRRLKSRPAARWCSTHRSSSTNRLSAAWKMKSTPAPGIPASRFCI